METGWDILFFWVARMILATTYVTGQIPFKTVYLHGLVRAEDGQKMSKSKPETMIDPLTVIPKYGSDALRLALIHGLSPGKDQRMSITKITAQRNFCNKLWNVARFIEGKIGDDVHGRHEPKPQTSADHWILTKLQHLTEVVSVDLEKYRFAEAYDKLYHTIWDDVADWYLEVAKIEPNTSVLAYTLETILKLLHPLAPFVTETIWQTLAWEQDSLLATSSWPSVHAGDKKQAKEFDAIRRLVSEIRYMTSELQLRDVTLLYQGEAPLIVAHSKLLNQLARLTAISEIKSGTGLQLLSSDAQAWLDVEAATIKKYAQRLAEQVREQLGQINRLEGRLANKAYVKQAPKALVDETSLQFKQAREQLAKLEA